MEAVVEAKGSRATLAAPATGGTVRSDVGEEPLCPPTPGRGLAGAVRAACLLLAALVLLPYGCGPDPESDTIGVPEEESAETVGTGLDPVPSGRRLDPQIETFVRPIEAGQGREAWYRHEALAADFELTFGGEEVLEARMLMRPDTSGVRLELEDGGVAVWDGESAWVAPDTELDRARFHLLTWPYFLAAPMKLRDPGTELSIVGRRWMGDQLYDAAKLTFEQGVGDSPDDWYIVYRQAETGRVEAMAYIVTYGGKSAEEAGEEPHVVTFEDFEEIDGVELPTTWRFWNWSAKDGIVGEEPIGEAKLSDVEFVEPEPGAFTRPAGATEAELPEAPAGGETAEGEEGDTAAADAAEGSG